MKRGIISLLIIGVLAGLFFVKVPPFSGDKLLIAAASVTVSAVALALGVSMLINRVKLKLRHH